jgi:hypothetical protein
MYIVTTSFMKFLKFENFVNILNFKLFFLKFWIFFFKFWNFMKPKILKKFWKILNFFEIFEILKKKLKFISEFSLIDDEVQVFRINIKLLSNPVAELKIRENDSHCRSSLLKNYWPLNSQTTGKGEK